jgi:hypothetical protein
MSNKSRTGNVDSTVILNALQDFNLHSNERGFVADCPACLNEDASKGAGKLLLSNEGNFSCMRFAGHDAASRKQHRQDIFDALGITSISQHKDYALDNGYVIRVSPSQSKGKDHVTLLLDGETVTIDTIKLDKDTERRRFIKSIPEEDQIMANAVNKLLMQLAGQAVAQFGDLDEPKRVYEGFVALDDGRVAEMTRAGFALYDPRTGETEMTPVIEFDGVTYMLPTDPIFTKPHDEGILLPPNVIEYGSDFELMKRIEAFISKYIDMSELDTKLAAAYVKFTYIADLTFELPYFRIVGATGTQSRGSGKSKLAGVLGRTCYRPFKVTSPSASSTFRTMDKYHPTLVIDEFNINTGSEDTAMMLQILNTGFMRGNLITRTEADPVTKEMVVNGFSPYGAKIIGGLAQTESAAFESRAIRVEMKKTTRTDLEYRTSMRQREEAAELRGMLTLWRLRHWGSINIENELDIAEAELKAFPIEPRYIQIGTPLYAILQDDDLKQEMVNMLIARTEDDAQDRKLSMEGYLVTILHTMLFEQHSDNEIYWADRDVCEDDEPCDLMTVKELTAKYNIMTGDEKPVSAKAVVSKLKKMSIRTRTIERRNSPQWKKSAVVFNLRDLVYQFKQYALPLPEDLEVPTERERAERIIRPVTKEGRKIVDAAWKEIEDAPNPLDDVKSWKGKPRVKQPEKWTDLDEVKLFAGGLSDQPKTVKPLVNKSNRIKQLKLVTRHKKTSGQSLVKPKTTTSSGLKLKPVQRIVLGKKVTRDSDQTSQKPTVNKNSFSKFEKGMFKK